MDYIGIKCPVCKNAFQENDDIVVCPECGAPYHRSCYQQEGHCIFTDKHAQGEPWRPPIYDAPEPPDTAREIKDKRCRRCGRMNAHSALFCDLCGYSLSGTPASHENTPPKYSNATPPTPPEAAPPSWPPVGFMNAYGMPFMLDPMGGYHEQEEVSQGVNAKEISSFVQNNSTYYMSVFRNMQSQQRNRFNFCAFLCSGGWMLYRKMYLLGGILAGIILALLVVSTYFNYFYVNPTVVRILGELKVDTSAGFTYQDFVTVFYTLEKQNPVEAFLLFVPAVASTLQLIIMLFCGVQANKLYLRHCVRNIEKIKALHPAAVQDPDAAPIKREAFEQELKSKGGVNLAAAVCIFVCYMIVTYIPMFIIA